jgi:hypothetical protein
VLLLLVLQQPETKQSVSIPRQERLLPQQMETAHLLVYIRRHEAQQEAEPALQAI